MEFVETILLAGCLAQIEPANSHWRHQAVGTPALFMDEGPVAVKVAEAHVMATVDMETLKKSYDQILATLNRVDERNHNSKACRDRPCHDGGLINLLKDRVCSLQQKLEFLCSSEECTLEFSAPEFPEVKRERYTRAEEKQRKKKFYFSDSFMYNYGSSRAKRFIPEILGALGLGLGIYDLVELQRVKQQVTAVRKEQGVLVHAVNQLHLSVAGLENRTKQIHRDLNQQSLWLGNLQSEVDFAKYVLELGQELDVFEDFLTAVLQTIVEKRVAPRLFSTEGLNSALNHISEEAHTLGLEIAGTGLADLADAPLSWIFSGSAFEIFLHLPVVDTESMRMYKWLKVPVHAGGGVNFGIRTRGEYLMVSDDSRKFREMALYERSHCSKRSGKLICPSGVQQVNPESSCLASLFLQREWLAAICSFEKLDEPAETLVQLGQNSTILVPPAGKKSVTVRLTCEGRHIAKVRLSGVQRIEIARGCVLSTPGNDFEVLASSVFTANLTVRELNLPDLMEKAKKLEKGINDVLEEHGIALNNGSLVKMEDVGHGRIMHEKTAENFGVLGVIFLAATLVTLTVAAAVCLRIILRKAREKTIRATLEAGAAHFQLLDVKSEKVRKATTQK